jgi:putative transposase
VLLSISAAGAVIFLILAAPGYRDGVKYYIIVFFMPRKARINQPGLSHHIMMRTFNDLKLFLEDEDRKYFLMCLSNRIKETGFFCYAWVLMDTHVHLLIKTTEQPLWKLMKPLNCDYAHYYNKRYNRRGPLFSDRFKSIATQDQYYLERIIRYIHLNPIRAGICRTITQLDRYPWSGHRRLMIDERGGFQETAQVLRRFGKKRDESRRKYREFVEAGMSAKDDDDIFSMLRTNNAGKRDRNTAGYWVIGDSEFQKSIIEKDRENRLTIARFRREGITLHDVLKKAAEKTGVDEAMVLCRSTRTPQAAARMILCFFARELGFPTIETGNFLGIQQAAVSHAARKGAELAREEKIEWA